MTAEANATASGTIGGQRYQYAGAAPTSVVSVGAAGAERQITHVAAGRVNGVSTDAINGSQLYATNQAIDTLSTSTNTAVGSLSTAISTSTGAEVGSLSTSMSTGLSTATSSIGSLSTGLSSITATTNNLGTSTATALGGGATYDPVTGQVKAPTYTMQNADGTTQSVHNVGDALNSINSQGIKYFHANSTAADSQALGMDAVAIGPKAVANNANDVALGAGSVTAGANATASGTIGGQTYQYAGATPTSVVSVGTAGAERQITNVAAGRVSATSTDAINGSQLYATNQQVDANTTNITHLTDGVNNGTLGLVQQDATSRAIKVASSTDGALVDFTGTSGTRGLGGVSAGVNGTDAVNVSQLKGVTAALGGAASVNPDGTIKQPTYTVNGNTYNNVGDAINAAATSGATDPNSVQYDNAAKSSVTLGGASASNPVQLKNVAAGTADTDAVNVAQLKGAGLIAQDPTGNLTSLAVTYDDATKGKVTLGGVNGTTLTNVKAGAVNASSTDAINGAQLYATNQAISTTVGTQGQNVADALGGGATYDPVTGQVKAPTYTMQNADGTTQSVHNVGDALNSINSQGIKYFHANSTAADSQALGVDAVAIGPKAVANNANDVALGAGSVTAEANATASGTIGGQRYQYAGAAPTSVVSVGAAGAERQITHVAAGRVNGVSTDAINGSQLYA
ncbi:hypothetical protein KDX15_34070, partial [Burkholderia cenocepacia]|nr:hypothetical protein [Burkholderia cenocepacia]